MSDKKYFGSSYKYSNSSKNKVLKFFQKPEVQQLIKEKSFDRLFTLLESPNNAFEPSEQSLIVLIIEKKIGINPLHYMTKIPRFFYFGRCDLEYITYEIDIYNKIEEINSYAFFDCENLTTVILPKNLNYIDSYVFDDCKKLQTVYMDNKVSLISYTAFNNCNKLQKVHFSGTSEEWLHISLVTRDGEIVSDNQWYKQVFKSNPVIICSDRVISEEE